MLALVMRGEFAGVVGTKSSKVINGVTVCVGDTVRVGEGSNNNPTEGVVAVFHDKISVMGLGATRISQLNILEITKSHTDLQSGDTLYNEYFKVTEFLIWWLAMIYTF